MEGSLYDQEPTMSAEEEELPPGVHFQPDDDELIELYLLPRCFGQPTAIPGVIIEDDGMTAAVLPSTLLERHGRGGDDEAYFFEPAGGDGSDGAPRQDRRCGSRGTWVWQRRWDGVLPASGAGGEGRVSWSKCLLNLHWGRGKRTGSTGWVMHEYTLVTNPPCPSPVKLCHVAFTGHGQKRQRVPDDDGDGRGVEKLARHAATPQIKRIVAAAAPSPSSAGASTVTFVDQELGAPLAQDQEVQIQEPSLVSDQPFSQDQEAAAAAATTTTMLVDQEPGVPVAGNEEHVTSHSQDCNQEQFQNLHEGTEMQAYCMLLASNARPRQEPDLGDYWHQLGGFLGSNEFPCFPSTAPPDAEACCNEEHDVQTMPAPAPPTAEPAGAMPLPMDQESGTADQDDFSWPWGGADAFCDVPEPENHDDDGCRNAGR